MSDSYTVNAPDPDADLAILLKALNHMINKAKPILDPSGVMTIGYKVPKREFDRVVSKHRRLTNG